MNLSSDLYTADQLALIAKAKKIIKRNTGIHLTDGEAYGALHVACIPAFIRLNLLDELNGMFNEHMEDA